MPLLEKKDTSDWLAQTELFQKVSNICSAVNVTLSPQELLDVSLDMTMDLFGAKRGSVFILEENGHDLVLSSSKGLNIQEQERLVKRLGEGVVGKVAEIKKPIVVEDIASDQRFAGHKPRGHYTTPSFICCPLLLKDKLIGVINIADKESGERFRSAEVQLLDFLTSQIALNYKRIQLYQKFKRLVKESKTLRDELGKSSAVTDKLKKQVIAQERLASLGKLAGGIAHELNNPLDGVLRYINLSLEQIKDSDEPIRDYLLEAKHGLNRMANIIRSLLACSRNTPPTMKRIAMNDAVEEGIKIVRSDLYHKNITIEKDLAQNLPLIVDFGIERITSNLIRNAIDALCQDGKIKVKSYQKGLTLFLQVSDTGCGIAQSEIEKIFEPFFTTKDIEKGCGLGLTIVNEIVKAYNGQIKVESELKKGTTFTIEIPIQDDYERL